MRNSIFFTTLLNNFRWISTPPVERNELKLSNVFNKSVTKWNSRYIELLKQEYLRLEGVFNASHLTLKQAHWNNVGLKVPDLKNQKEF